MDNIAQFLGLNEEQAKAIDIDKNIALSAGAGSGKTRVLTSRFLNLLENDIEIEKIVAITFTDKAALEMKSRIREAIITLLNSQTKEAKQKYQTILDKLNKANISTIHSFCMNIVRENAHEIGIDFDFGIISEMEKDKFLKEKLKESLNEAINIYSNSDADKEIINFLMDALGEKYFSTDFYNDILKIRKDILESGATFEQIYENTKEDKISTLILKLLMDVEKKFYEFKLNSDLLDYEDLQSIALKILENKNIRESYKELYTRFLVDEFQDTNEIQRKILYHLVGDEDENLLEKRLFIVGDFKQAIYGFRGTDYTIFEKVAKSINEDGRLMLKTCYRSEKEIIHGINEIFKPLIENYQNLNPKEYGDINVKRINIITYSKDKNENNNCKFKKIKEIIKSEKSLDINEFKNALDELKSYTKYDKEDSKEAKTVIKAVKLLKDKGLNYEDICILVRSRGIVTEIENELSEYKVPYCIIGGIGFLERQEVIDVLTIYELITQGFQESLAVDRVIKLLSILKSPIFNLSDNDLFEIKRKQEEMQCSNLVEAMEHLPSFEKIYSILMDLENFNKKYSVVKTLEHIINICNIKEIAIMQKNGVQKYRNLEKLLNIANTFDKEQLFTNEEFLEYIELLKEGEEYSQASLDTEDSKAVKIMTIHKSKGLEFKGVIIPGINKDVLSVAKREGKRKQLAYAKNHILCRYNLSRQENEDYKEYEAQKLIKEIDEAIRVLYVAMTRAEEYIVLVGEEDDKEIDEQNLNTYQKMINYSVKMQNANTAAIEFLKEEEIEDLNACEVKENKNGDFNQNEISHRLNFEKDIQPIIYTSASKYMNYKQGQKKVTIGVNHDEVLEELRNDKINNLEINIELDSALKGRIAHKLIEIIEDKDSYKHHIEALCSDLDLEVEKKDFLRDELTRYAQNYFEIEQNNNDDFGDLVKSYNEMSVLFSPKKEAKTIIVGYIDNVKIYSKNGENTAVIVDYKTNKINSETAMHHLSLKYRPQLLIYAKVVKELLNIDKLILKLYFLDVGKEVSIDYDDEVASQIIREMGEMKIKP